MTRYRLLSYARWFMPLLSKHCNKRLVELTVDKLLRNFYKSLSRQPSGFSSAGQARSAVGGRTNQLSMDARATRGDQDPSHSAFTFCKRKTPFPTGARGSSQSSSHEKLMLGHSRGKAERSLARSLSDCFTLNCPRAEMLSTDWIPSPAGQRAAKPVADSSCPGSGRPAPVLRESGASEIRRVTCPLKLEPSVGKAYSW